MRPVLRVHRAGPGASVQDAGRPGFLDHGLSRGGAADRLALAEGAALLGQSPDLAAIEMAGGGAEFSADAEIVIALSGAPMRATVDGARLAWNAAHRLPAGARLSIGAAGAGTYGYLHVAGGIDAPCRLGARSAHLAAGIGAPLGAGERLAIGTPATGGGARAGLALPADDRFSGGTVRVVASAHTALFAADTRARFAATAFARHARANRMGARLEGSAEGFALPGGRGVVSEVVVPGDIQITGDGTPFVLLCECQTTGGYPRIATVLPCDLPRVAQAPAGAPLRFRFVALAEAVAAERAAAALRAALPGRCRPLVRDPATIADLLGLQLISGVTAGDDPDQTTEGG